MTYIVVDILKMKNPMSILNGVKERKDAAESSNKERKLTKWSKTK